MIKEINNSFDEEEEEAQDENLPDIDDVEEIDIDNEDVVETLLSTLRKMAKVAGFEKSYVFTDDDGCINVQFVLNKKERMASVMKVMNFLKKLETDILIQYESEFDLWETKQGEPLLTGKFYYDEDVEAPKKFDDLEAPF